QLRDARGPGRVELAGQRQRLVGTGQRQRQSGDVRVPGIERLRAEAAVEGLGRVERSARARVEGGQAAAREVVVHLGAHRVEDLGRGGGVLAQRANVVGLVLGRAMPV